MTPAFFPVSKPLPKVQISFIVEAVQKRNFGQPLAKISLPKAQKSLSNPVFGPLAGQKLDRIKILVPSAGQMEHGAVQNEAFGQPLKEIAFAFGRG
jgi:hypothetical protein